MGKIQHPDVGVELTRPEWETEIHRIGGVANLDVVRPATTVLAASNSPAIWKAEADVVCTGVHDEVAVIAALVNGNVLLAPGNFKIAAPITHGSRLSFRGSGIDVTYLDNTSSPLNGYTILPNVATEQWEISDLTLNGGHIGIIGTFGNEIHDAAIRRVKGVNVPGMATGSFITNRCYRILFEDCVTANGGVFNPGWGSYHLILRRCKALGGTPAMSEAFQFDDFLYDIVMDECLVVGRYAVEINNHTPDPVPHDIKILNSWFIDCPDYAIQVWMDGSPASYEGKIIIRGNHFINATNWSLFVGRLVNAGVGIMHGIVIEDNVFETKGILLGNAALVNNPRGFLITSNIFKDMVGTGIDVEGDLDDMVINLNIFDNVGVPWLLAGTGINIITLPNNLIV